MSPAKRSSDKQKKTAASKQTGVTRAVKKAVRTAGKAVAKKTPSRKKPVAKKTTGRKKPTAKKATGRKKPATAKKTTGRKKPAAKKPTARKKTTGRKKPTAKKATGRKKPATAKKSAGRKPTKRSAPKKPAAKKPATKKPATKKPAAKRSAPKKPAAKKPGGGPDPGAAGTGARPSLKSKLPPRPPVVEPPKKVVRKPKLDKRSLAKIKDRLERDKLDYERQLAELESDSSSGDTNPDIGVNEDFADAGTATFDRERDLSIRNNTLDLIDQAARALESIEQGTYGTCESCGNHIDADRLEAFPRMLLCLDCKRREERIR